MKRHKKSRQQRQELLIVKYRHRGMSKTNFRKLHKKEDFSYTDATMPEMEGSAINPRPVPQWDNARKG